eukprot:718135-Hanusia_phi.AAC.1
MKLSQQLTDVTLAPNLLHDNQQDENNTYNDKTTPCAETGRYGKESNGTNEGERTGRSLQQALDAAL